MKHKFVEKKFDRDATVDIPDNAKCVTIEDHGEAVGKVTVRYLQPLVKVAFAVGDSKPQPIDLRN